MTMSQDKQTILILESFAWTPHIETAAEIAISNARQGEKVVFAFLDADNPDDLSRENEAGFEQVLGFNYRNRIRQLQKILIQHGIEIHTPQPLPEEIQSRIKAFTETAPLSLEELRNYQYKGAALGLAVVSSLISRTGFSKPDLRDYDPLVRRYLEAAATVFEQAGRVLSELKPHRVISFNGRFACAKGIFEAAAQAGIPSFYHERGATFDRYAVHSRPVHDIVYIRSRIRQFWDASDNGKETIGHQFFSLRRQGHGIGWTSFTTQQIRDMVPADIERRKIVYFSSSDDELAAVGNLVKQPIFPDQQAAIGFLIDWVNQQSDVQLIIRVHPHLLKKSPEDRKWWLSLGSEKVTIIPPDSPVDSYALMGWADIVVSYGSTAGVEAAYWGKPSILLGDSLYRELNCVYEPRTTGEIVDLLGRSDLTPLPQNNCLPYGHYCLNHGIKYEHYKPTDLFSGSLCGHVLTSESAWISAAKKWVPQVVLRRIGRLRTTQKSRGDC